MRSDAGSVTLWMVGLVMVVFAVGGISIDLWRALAAHRQVAAVVDAAAVAAGSGIDEEAWRTSGVLRLDPDLVEARVEEVVAAQSPEVVSDYAVVTAEDGSSATVRAITTIDLTLLDLLVDGPLTVDAEASVSPVVSSG